MLQTVYKSEHDGFHWIDATNPTEIELKSLGEQYGLHPASLQDCLEPEHLPKFERFGSVAFIIARAFDDDSSENSEADTVQELTRKIAIYFGPGFLLTIHRLDQPFLIELRQRWATSSVQGLEMSSVVLIDILSAIFNSYDKPITVASDVVDSFETQVFTNMNAPLILQEMYLLKRKALVFKRLLRMSQETLPKIQTLCEQNGPHFQDLKESLDHLFFFADELLDTVNNLVNLQISLASHRTNEVVRVLTVFSVFFMPLTFIVGVYGMNFKFMPELEARYGYLIVWIVMLSVCVAIMSWFRKRGWLKF